MEIANKTMAITEYKSSFFGVSSMSRMINVKKNNSLCYFFGAGLVPMLKVVFSVITHTVP